MDEVEPEMDEGLSEVVVGAVLLLSNQGGKCPGVSVAVDLIKAVNKLLIN